MEQKKKREIKLSKGNNEKKIIKMNTMEKKKRKRRKQCKTINTLRPIDSDSVRLL